MHGVLEASNGQPGKAPPRENCPWPIATSPGCQAKEVSGGPEGPCWPVWGDEEDPCYVLRYPAFQMQTSCLLTKGGRALVGIGPLVPQPRLGGAGCSYSVGMGPTSWKQPGR